MTINNNKVNNNYNNINMKSDTNNNINNDNNINNNSSNKPKCFKIFNYKIKIFSVTLFLRDGYL